MLFLLQLGVGGSQQWSIRDIKAHQRSHKLLIILAARARLVGTNNEPGRTIHCKDRFAAEERSRVSFKNNIWGEQSDNKAKKSIRGDEIQLVQVFI